MAIAKQTNQSQDRSFLSIFPTDREIGNYLESNERGKIESVISSQR
jgi:hypothetical protein